MWAPGRRTGSWPGSRVSAETNPVSTLTSGVQLLDVWEVNPDVRGPHPAHGAVMPAQADEADCRLSGSSLCTHCKLGPDRSMESADRPQAIGRRSCGSSVWQGPDRPYPGGRLHDGPPEYHWGLSVLGQHCWALGTAHPRGRCSPEAWTVLGCAQTVGLTPVPLFLP